MRGFARCGAAAAVVNTPAIMARSPNATNLLNAGNIVKCPGGKTYDACLWTIASGYITWREAGLSVRIAGGSLRRDGIKWPHTSAAFVYYTALSLCLPIQSYILRA